MERFLKGVCTFLPHLIIAMSVTLLTLSITDHYNTAMAFINHPMTKRLILIYCLLSLAVCLILLVRRLDCGIEKIMLPLICTAMTAVMLTALFYDWVRPRDILFTKDIGKAIVFVNTLVSLVHAAYTAAVNRNIAMRNYRKQIKKIQGKR